MAVRITLKRSSILNKRPTSQILDPGELALNTNALSPGLFFEADNNSVVKVGPTAVGTEPPVLVPSLGESFYNTVTNSLSIGSPDPVTAEQTWRSLSTPWLGGTNGYVVFVAPEFPNSSDSILNDGQSAPFKTLNRAILEIGKQSIVKANESDEQTSARFTIVVQAGLSPVYNDPGLPVQVPVDSEEIPFNVNFDTNPEVTIQTLTQFNPTTGGLIIPRGTSIQGMDLRKTKAAPSYVPTYQAVGEYTTLDQPISSVLKWTGNSYVTNLTFKDKTSVVQVGSFREYKQSNSGLFVSLQAHGFSLNDRVYLSFSAGANRTPVGENSAPLQDGEYYVYPVGLNEFLLSFTKITAGSANYVELSQLPDPNQGLAYICECTWKPYSHHRLRCLTAATEAEMNEFYVKIQKAFPTFFDGRVDQAEVINPGETQYVAPVPPALVDSLQANRNDNASPYASNCSLKSSYGMCGVEHDADLITGFRSALISQFTAASIQNDPHAYEVYVSILDPETSKYITKWLPLNEACWNSLPVASRPQFAWEVPWSIQMEYLNTVAITNIRYAFTTQTTEDGLSYGLPDLNNDFRHFGFRVQNGGYMQIDTGWTIGTAVGFWGLNGSKLSITNSTSNFGSLAIRTEGFRGIGTLGGALSQDSGFSFAGIRMPQRLNPFNVNGFTIYSLGPSIESVVNDDSGVQIVTLGPGFEPITLLPYSLAPNTALWVQDAANIYRGFFVDDGQPTAVFLPSGRCQLRLRAIDSSIPEVDGLAAPLLDWEPPYIKRFQDERNIQQQSYCLILQNTSPGHRDPVQGGILRLQQQNANTTQATLVRPGVQLDPGPTGGWGRVFQAAFSQTSSDGDAPQYNETLLNRPTSSNYYVALSSVDTARPWLEEFDRPHGAYVTWANRNWYASCNDEWTGVYFSSEGVRESDLKLLPDNYNSPYATSFCLETQTLVDKTYQGLYAPDDELELYPEDSTYFRGSETAPTNYDFSDYYNEDNGTPNFGLLRHDTPSGVSDGTSEIVTPEMDYIPVGSIGTFDQLYNPKKDFIVVSISNEDQPERLEYCQVIGYDLFNSALLVIRGVYGTHQDADWPDNSTVILQQRTFFVSPEDYDKNWSPTKSAMIRFLRIMGFETSDIFELLQPRNPSSRNLYLKDISIEPKKGYALSVGPWGFEFNQPSTVNCSFHQFYSVGYFSYSKGLPQYQVSNINTKQMYDFMSTSMWGGYLTLFGQNENGQTLLEGDLTQAQTGRPYGSYSSDITPYTRIKVDTREDGEEDTGVKLVDTGVGLAGGPITEIGVISLVPAKQNTIGGVKPGNALVVTPDGTLNLDPTDVGTVQSITFGVGLSGGTITRSGTVNLLPPTGGEIGGILAGDGVNTTAEGTLNLNPATVSSLGGVIVGTALTVTPSGTLSAALATNTTVGVIKPGPGLTVQADGTLTLDAGPKIVQQIDDLTPQFDGVRTSFGLAIGGTPYSPPSINNILISLGGIVQTPVASFSVNGANITFTSPPPTGASFYGIAYG